MLKRPYLGIFYFQYHSGFDGGRVNCLHNSSYCAIFWPCNESSVDNTNGSAIAELLTQQDLLCFSYCPTSEASGGAQEVGDEGDDTARTFDSNGQKGYSMPYDIMLTSRSWGKEGGKDIWSDGFCLPKKLLLKFSPAFLELAEYLCAARKYQEKKHFIFLLLQMWLLLYVLDCLYLNPRVFSLLSF